MGTPGNAGWTRYAVGMETRLVLVALVTLALGCGETQGVTDDAGSDAEAVDLGGLDVAVDDAGSDAGPEVDAGWCVSEPCIQRLNYFGECMDNVMTDFPCEAPAGTYDGVCSAAGVCVGTPCECSEGPCCDGCLLLAEDARCNMAPDEGPTICDGQDALWDLHFRLCDGGESDCGDRFETDGQGTGRCPVGTQCDSNAPQGMRCSDL
jgi:hypothetical protein